MKWVLGFLVLVGFTSTIHRRCLVTNDLFLAILSMDAYNRTGELGTSQGLILPTGTMIGNAAILSGAGGVLEDTAHSFFAQGKIGVRVRFLSPPLLG